MRFLVSIRPFHFASGATRLANRATPGQNRQVYQKGETKMSIEHFIRIKQMTDMRNEDTRRLVKRFASRIGRRGRSGEGHPSWAVHWQPWPND